MDDYYYYGAPVSVGWLFYGSGMHRAGWSFDRCLAWGIHRVHVL